MKIKIHEDQLFNSEAVQRHLHFTDSLAGYDRILRRMVADSIDPYYSHVPGDTIYPHYMRIIEENNSRNGEAIIEYAKEFGFPAGKNFAGDNAAYILINMNEEWLRENYFFIIRIEEWKY